MIKSRAAKRRALATALRSLPASFVLLATAGLAGCQSTLGPQAIERTHPAYNEAIIASENEQMLQNIVRLRYRDVAFFLEIGSVTASLSLRTNAGVDANVQLGGGDSLSPNTGVSYSDNPTISYRPLKGQELLKSILSPLELESILVLTRSGWDISRVFGLCIERINDLYNAPTASGPTPKMAPKYEKFNQLLQSLRALQNRQLIEIEKLDDDIVVELRADAQELNHEIDQLYTLLQLDRNATAFSLNTNFLDQTATRWTVRPRSVNGLLYYLSQHVDVPRQHQTAGLVTTTLTKNESSFDWGRTPAGRLFHVRTSAKPPANAYVATHYRGHWFYIEDRDLQSKSTFMLLRQLFDLQAGQTVSQGPTLTLPVGAR